MLYWLLGMMGKPWTLQLQGNIRDGSLVLLLIVKTLLSVIQVMVNLFFSVHTLPLFVTFPEPQENVQ